MLREGNSAGSSVSLQGVTRNRCCGIQTLSIDTGAVRVASFREKRSGNRSHLGSTHPGPLQQASILGSSSPQHPSSTTRPRHATGSISTNQSSTCHFISPAADSTFPSPRNISKSDNDGENNNNNNNINNYKERNISNPTPHLTPPGPRWTSGY